MVLKNHAILLIFGQFFPYNVHSFSLVVELGTLVQHAAQVLALFDPLLKVDLLSQAIRILRIVSLTVF